MVNTQNQLFNKKTINRLCQDIVITDTVRVSVNEWLKLLEKDELKNEKSNYLKFKDIVLEGVLGYSRNRIHHEEDNMEFQVSDSDGEKILCIEAKGTATKNLFIPQHRTKKEHETPIKQTWDYMGKAGLDYGICTNYKDFILITKHLGYTKFHLIDFTTIKNNEEKLREFIGIFSQERIIDKGFVEKLRDESQIEEKEFTKEFYKLFHETRLMLIKSFENKEDVSRTEAVYYTQIFLNRLIFIFFVSDRGFLSDNRLFSNRISKLLELGQCTEHSRKIYDEISELFIAFDKGSKQLGIFGFNGGLFGGKIPSKAYFSDLLYNLDFFSEERQNSKLLKSTKLNENITKIVEQYDQVNPIISNLLILDSFDFNSEVNVNILGHIFEQSISDLEELKKNKDSRRKKEGVYYTPEYITDYICRNTIIPFLSETKKSSVHDLIEEYSENIENLERKFRDIKILDPACGSGAFLIKCIDILLEIYEGIQTVKHRDSVRQTILNEEDEIRKIIENSIYGVDINTESVEITKLSLFLKIASNNRKLTELSKNIRVGNSIVDDGVINSCAFVWKDEFQEVLKNGKFDVIVGNPPYGAELSKNEQKYLSEKFCLGSTDTAQLMISQSHELLKPKGYHGFIVPKALIYASNWKNIRDRILDDLKILLDVGKVWKEVKLEQSIYILQKDENHKSYLNGIRKDEYLGTENKIEKTYVKEFGFLLSGVSNEDLELGRKIFKNSEKLEKYVENRRGSMLQGKIKKNGEISTIGGQQIQRCFISGTKGYLDKMDIDDEKAIVCENSVLAQNIVAHIENPVDHIKITSTVPINLEYAILDTINQLIVNGDVSNYFISALLNSKLINWYCYRFIFGKAIRTMHFDKPVTNRIPIINSRQKDVDKNMKQLIELNEQLLDITAKYETTLKTTLEIDKLNTKIKNIYDLEFNEFSKNITKIIKRKLSPKENSEWIEYFNEQKEKIKKLTNKIKQLKHELDLIFYENFNLTASEIELIEKSTPI